jgi:hypothetical protein
MINQGITPVILSLLVPVKSSPATELAKAVIPFCAVLQRGDEDRKLLASEDGSYKEEKICLSNSCKSNI